jgi:hypothetical protein
VWREPKAQAKRKDEVEDALLAAACYRHTISLQAAQAAIRARLDRNACRAGRTMNDDSSVSDAHLLTIAVADGTVTAEAAYCGLSPAEVHSLADRHPTLDVLVRLRSADADGRTVVKGYAIPQRSPGSPPQSR